MSPMATVNYLGSTDRHVQLSTDVHTQHLTVMPIQSNERGAKKLLEKKTQSNIRTNTQGDIQYRHMQTCSVNVYGWLTSLTNFHTTQVVSLEPVIRCSPVPALSSAIHVTMSTDSNIGSSECEW